MDTVPTITPPSRLERALRGAGYAMVGGIGAYMLINPPDSLGAALGSLLLVVSWCLLMLAGLPAAVCAVLGRYRGEYMLLPLFTGGVAIADVNLFVRWWNGGAPFDDNLLLRAMIIAALVLVYAARYVTLRRLVKIGTTLERHGRFWGRI